MKSCVARVLAYIKWISVLIQLQHCLFLMLYWDVGLATHDAVRNLLAIPMLAVCLSPRLSHAICCVQGSSGDIIFVPCDTNWNGGASEATWFYRRNRNWVVKVAPWVFPMKCPSTSAAETEAAARQCRRALSEAVMLLPWRALPLLLGSTPQQCPVE